MSVYNVSFLLQSYSLYSVSCVLPAPPLNGALLNTNSQNTNLVEGSVITFQCDPGFSLVGAATVTCNNSGLWYPDPALWDCVSRSCTYTQVYYNADTKTFYDLRLKMNSYSATTKESRFFFWYTFITFCGISSKVKVI